MLPAQQNEMMVAGTFDPAIHVASGVLGPGVGLTPNSVGAQNGDLMIVFVPFGPGAPSGAGTWSGSTFTWNGGGYSGGYYSAVLTNVAAAITFTSSYGVAYMVLRNAETMVFKSRTDAGGSDPNNVDFGTPAANCVAQVAFSARQVSPGTGTSPTAPGFTRTANLGPDLMHMGAFLDNVEPYNTGNVVFTLGSVVSTYVIIALEVRRTL